VQAACSGAGTASNYCERDCTNLCAAEQVAAMLSDAQFYGSLTARIPLSRIAEPEDIMQAVLFLVAPASNFITGQTLFLDGDITATQ